MSSALRIATLDDLIHAAAEGLACELVDGELVEKAAPDQAHGGAQLAVATPVFASYNRRRGGGGGGWWIRAEVEIAFGADVLRPDLSGWRRDRVPVMPEAWPVPVAPDWVCEILSPSTAGRDLGPKRDRYHQAGVGDYWVVDRAHQLLLVYRHGPGGYVLVQSAGAAERLHPEPFEAIDLFVGQLFGIDPPEDPPAP